MSMPSANHALETAGATILSNMHTAQTL